MARVVGLGLTGVLVALAVGACVGGRGRKTPADAARPAPLAVDAAAVTVETGFEPDVVPEAEEESGEPPDGGVEEASAPARVVEEGAVTVRRVVTCQKVERRRPIVPATTFRRGRRDTLSVYLELEVPHKDAKYVKVSLEPLDGSEDEGRPVKLVVTPSRLYRTYATFRTAGRAAGAYEAVVRDREDRIVALAPVQLLE